MTGEIFNMVLRNNPHSCVNLEPRWVSKATQEEVKYCFHAICVVAAATVSEASRIYCSCV